MLDGKMIFAAKVAIAFRKKYGGDMLHGREARDRASLITDVMYEYWDLGRSPEETAVYLWESGAIQEVL